MKLQMKSFILLLAFLVTWPSIAGIQKYTLSNPDLLIKKDKVGDIYIGGFSGAQFISENKDSIELYVVTDRGPNTNSFDFNKDGQMDRGFLYPQYSPMVLKLRLQGESVTLLDKIVLKNKNLEPLSGLPNIPKSKRTQNFDETPFDLEMAPLPFDSEGIDPEGLAVDQQGNIWVAEEYAPSIVKFNKEGVLIDRYIPNVVATKRVGKPVLPEILSHRLINHGLEALTIINKKLYSVLQAPVESKNNVNRVNYILEFDIEKNKTTGLYVYLMDSEGRKIGGMTRWGEDLLIYEQNGKIKKDKSFKRVFRVKFEKATNLLDRQIDHTLTHRDLIQNKILPVIKIGYLNFDKGKLRKHKKVEGFTITDSGKLIFAVDNDFGLEDVINSEDGSIISQDVKKSSYIYVRD